MYLLDSSISLELLLDQEKADDVEQLLHTTPSDSLHISEFSLYSIGIILLRRNSHNDLIGFVNDMFATGAVRLVRLGVDDIQHLVEVSSKFNLDFDDAYQYATAEKYNLTLVSFDSDFDGTERGRKTPAEILKL